MRRALLFTTAAAAVVGLAAEPALAAPSDSTTATFTINTGTLSIDTPGSANLGSGVPGATVTGALGQVTVTDQRAAANASWTATVTSTDFTTASGGTGQVIPASQVDYWSGPAISTVGNGTFTPGQPTSAAAQPLSNTTPLTAFTHSGGTGNNSAIWNPNLIVNVPVSAEGGLYTGTVTHSVA
ncbi:hypothetical protein [Micromonospora sp. NPDC006431]|uniref:hypothetical protein n=1 Tax=Micromonospora sp. NPDC006431 TaxID=3364235 RepID=UPI0036D08CFA